MAALGGAEKAPRHEERDALPLCVGMVLRAAEFAATEQTAAQALTAWLSCGDAQRTIEVRTTATGDAQHAALVRWMRAAATSLCGAQIQLRTAAPSWRTVCEKKLNLYFEKSRVPVKTWGAGDVRKWHLRPALVEYIEQAVRDPASIAKAIAAAAAERDASSSLVLLSWPSPSAVPTAAASKRAAPTPVAPVGLWMATEPEPEPEPEPEQQSSAMLSASDALAQIASAVRAAVLAGCAAPGIAAVVEAALQPPPPRTPPPQQAPPPDAAALPQDCDHGHAHGSPKSGAAWQVPAYCCTEEDCEHCDGRGAAMSDAHHPAHNHAHGHGHAAGPPEHDGMSHVHGPGCGHMAIKLPGDQSIAFADLDSGDMDVSKLPLHLTQLLLNLPVNYQVFSAPAGHSLDDLCFYNHDSSRAAATTGCAGCSGCASAEPHVHAHVREFPPFASTFAPSHFTSLHFTSLQLIFS